jgi:hypothetical protein
MSRKWRTIAIDSRVSIEGKLGQAVVAGHMTPLGFVGTRPEIDWAVRLPLVAVRLRFSPSGEALTDSP